MEVTVVIRHHDKGAPAKIYNEGPDRLRVEFQREVSAVTPGQSAVVFDGDDVVAGGFILKKI